MANYYAVFGIMIFAIVISGFPIDENISGNKFIRSNLQCFASDDLGIDQDVCPAPKALNRRQTKYSDEEVILYKKDELDSSTSSKDHLEIEEELDEEKSLPGNPKHDSFFSKYNKNSLKKCEREKVPHEKHAKNDFNTNYKDHKKHDKGHKEKSVITHSSNQYFGDNAHSTREKDLELNELATVEESVQDKTERSEESDLETNEFNPAENINAYSKEDSEDIRSVEFELNAQSQNIPEEKINAEDMKFSSNESLDLEEQISEESIDHPGPAEELHFDKLVPANSKEEIAKVTTSEVSTTTDETMVNTGENVSTTTESGEDITDNSTQTTNSTSDTSATISSTNEDKIDSTTDQSTSEMSTTSSTISSTTVVE